MIAIRIRPLGSYAERRTIHSSHEFRAEAIFRRDAMYFRTNDHAQNWKLMAASYAKPVLADWTTLISEQTQVLADVTVTSAWVLAILRDGEGVKGDSGEITGSR
jgi:protease II